MKEYVILWQCADGEWVRETVRARSAEDAMEHARRISELFGTGKHEVHATGR